MNAYHWKETSTETLRELGDCFCNYSDRQKRILSMEIPSNMGVDFYVGAFIISTTIASEMIASGNIKGAVQAAMVNCRIGYVMSKKQMPDQEDFLRKFMAVCAATDELKERYAEAQGEEVKRIQDLVDTTNDGGWVPDSLDDGDDF